MASTGLDKSEGLSYGARTKLRRTRSAPVEDRFEALGVLGWLKNVEVVYMTCLLKRLLRWFGSTGDLIAWCKNRSKIPALRRREQTNTHKETHETVPRTGDEDRRSCWRDTPVERVSHPGWILDGTWCGSRPVTMYDVRIFGQASSV